MCCDGSLFMRADVRPHEDHTHLRSLGLDVLEQEGKPVFRLPCKNLAAQGCSIYPARPFTCRQFRCELLKAYESGAVSLSEASARIDKVKALLAGGALRQDLEAITPERGLDYRKLLEAAHSTIAASDNPAAMRKCHAATLAVAMQVVHSLQCDFYRPAE